MLYVRQHNITFTNFLDQINAHLIFVFLSALFSAVFFIGSPDCAATDLADVPLMTNNKPAPANIMFLLDDSVSMTFEVLIKGKYNGRYPKPEDDSGENGFCYIFDYLNDDTYADSSCFMGTEGRKFWQSQYFDKNVTYYNPDTTYEPWPEYPGQNFDPADKENPKPHPTNSNVQPLDLDGASFNVTLEKADGAEADLDVKHAHYFVKSGKEDPYLVVIDGEVNNLIYYKVIEVEGSGLTQKVTKVKEVRPDTLPEGIKSNRGYDEERQNFANWFTFHRRRQYVAIDAIARVIKKLKGVRVGILGINGKIIAPLKPIGVWKEGVFYDDTGDLLKELYNHDTEVGTPLREGLNDIGKYYKNNTKKLEHYKGNKVEGDDPPYFPEADGGACQQSFTIIVTDGYYSYDIKDLGIGNADGDNKSDYDGGFYGDSLGETLADVAMYYYENDLVDSLADRVYEMEQLRKSNQDRAPHQHMVTFGVVLGLSGNLHPDNYRDDPASEDYLKNTNGEYPVWPTSVSIRSEGTIDDLFHATVNGRGKFLTAKNPQSLVSALTELISNVLDGLGSSSPISVNRDAFFGQVGDEVLMFQARYKTNVWSGDVKAYRVDTSTGEILADDPKWSAADSLDSKPWNQRNILSYNGSFGIELDENQLTETQKTKLGADFRDIVHFIKGEKIDGYRTRLSKLGDIVHSSPVFEEGVVYVGANDGMLHAFEITIDNDRKINGDEIFAYVPSFVFENLKGLADPAYFHKFYVDLTPTVSKGHGLLGGGDSATILVGGLGKGGKGYFGLDITAPKSMSPGMVLWEFPNKTTDRNDKNDIGYSYSRPVVVMTNSANKKESWIVIFGNGYDSANGNAVLFILNPKTGEIVKKIVADNPSVDPGNGLSSPIAVDVNSDRKVDFVYAGDLHGNMWKFDLTGDDSAQWKIAYNDGTNDQPLFKAQGPDGSVQPITSKPEVMLHPQKHGLMVLFGTGKLMGKSDFIDNSTQTVYGIWDYGDRVYFPDKWGDYSNDDDQEYLGSFTINNLSNQPENVTLLEQTSNTYTLFVTDGDDNSVNVNLRAMSNNKPSWSTRNDGDTKGSKGEPNLPDLSNKGTSHAGWYYNLPLIGERVISDVLLRDGRLIVISFIPDPDRCSDGGTSFFMELNAFTGGSNSAVIFDINEDDVIDIKDTVIVGYDDKSTPIRMPPAGINLPGNLQLPAILRLNNRIGVNYLSASTGAIHMLKEKAVRLGVTYWKELEQ